MNSMPLPDLLRVSPFKVREDQNVDTSILDPVVSTGANCRFVIPNKGILNSETSKINLGLKCTGDVDGKHEVYVPLVNGVYSVVNRAILKVGTKIIGEIQDLNFWMSYYSALLHPKVVRDKEQVLTGRGLSFGVNPYNEDLDVQGTNLNNGYTYQSFHATGMAVQQTDNNDLHIPFYNNAISSAVNVNKILNYQLSLKELFPILADYNLPLYLMKEQLSIELFYSANEDHLTMDEYENTNYDAKLSVDPDNVFLIVDYIYYPEEKMMEIAKYYTDNEFQDSRGNRRNGGRFNYVSQELVRSSIPDGASGQAFIRNVGGAGRVVHKIMCMNNTVITEADDKIGSILNSYISTAPDNMSIQYNLIYNDLKCFPVNVSNPALVAKLIKEAEGIPIYLPVSNFSNMIIDSAAQKVSNRLITTMDGERFYTCVSLANNKRINQRGILLQQNATFNGGTTPVNNRAWLEVEKVYSLDRNGIVEINYA